MAGPKKRRSALADGRGAAVPAALDLRGQVTFLIDTGADRTCIHLPDSSRLGIDPSQLADVTSLGGIGGQSQYAREPAGLVFLGADQKTVLEAVPALLIGLPNRSPNVVSLYGP